MIQGGALPDTRLFTLQQALKHALKHSLATQPPAGHVLQDRKDAGGRHQACVRHFSCYDSAAVISAY